MRTWKDLQADVGVGGEAGGFADGEILVDPVEPGLRAPRLR